MKILDRYIGSAVLTGTLVAMLIVVGLDMFFTVIDQVSNIGKGGYTFSIMARYVVSTLPQSVYELFPMSALLGSLMGLGGLSANSELIAMRASGVSIWRIVRSVLQTGALMLVVIVVIGEWLAPAAKLYGQNLRVTATGQPGISYLGGNGLWVRDEARFINARRVLDPRQLADLTVYEFDADKRLTLATRATHAEYVDGNWQLHDVEQSIFSQQGVTTRHVGLLYWPSLLTPDLLGVVTMKPKFMSARDIHQLVGYLDENGLDTEQYRFAYWGRYLTPVSALVMLLVSVPFVFGSLRSVSAGQRVFIGVLTGFGFYILSQVAAQMGQVYGLLPLPTMLVPNLLFVLLGVRAIQRL